MWKCKNCGGTEFIATIIAEQEGEFNKSGEFEAEFDDIKEIADWEED